MKRSSWKGSVEVTGDDVTYTATESNGSITISWGENNSVTYKGNVNAGSTMTLQWEQASSFYNYRPPAASFNSLTSSVDWNLNSRKKQVRAPGCTDAIC